MSEIGQAISFFIFFMLGVIGVCWSKVNDISNMKEDLDFKQTLNLFAHKEWRSYGFSITVALVYAGAHDEWMRLILTSKYTPDFIIQQLGAAPMIGSFFFGVVIQYTGYKFWLGKLDKLFRNELQQEQKNLKQENEQLKKQLGDKTP